MRDAENRVFYIGEWRIESRLNRIYRGDRSLKLEPKVMNVLIVLADNPGHVFSKDELIEAVWKETVVSEDVLARAISELRRAFGDDSRNPAYIETIYKSGYRLISQVRKDSPVSRSPGAERRPRAMWPGALALFPVAIVCWWIWSDGRRDSPQWEFTPATAQPGLEVRPALAPDARSFAYAWSGAEVDNWDIYVKQFDADSPRRLTHDPARDGGAAWSPDGNTLAFIRYAPGSCSIMWFDLSDNLESRLAGCTGASYADLEWSGDGRWLAYNDKPDGDLSHAIMLLDVDTGELRTLTHPPDADWGDYDPAFSPDGRTVFFARARSEGIQDLFAVDIASGKETQLTDDGRNIYGIDVSSDGDWVFYSSNRGGLRYEIWRQPTAGGPPQRYLNGAMDLVNPSLSRDADLLLVEQRSYDINLWQAVVGSDQPATAFAPSSRWEMYPAYSRDGRSVAFSSNRSGSYEIWVTPADKVNPRKVTRFAGPLSAAPRWSPIDDRLVFASRPDGHADVFVRAGADGNITALTDDTADDLAPNWSHDGKWVYFASNRSGEWEIWKTPATGGQAKRVTHAGGYSAHESDDGSTLYFARYAEAGIWSMPTEGGAPRRLIDALDPGDWGNWGLYDGGIWYLDRSDKQRVMSYDPAGRSPATLLHAPNRPMLAGEVTVTLSRDGRYLLYAQVDRRDADIVKVHSGR